MSPGGEGIQNFKTRKCEEAGERASGCAEEPGTADGPAAANLTCPRSGAHPGPAPRFFSKPCSPYPLLLPRSDEVQVQTTRKTQRTFLG